MASPLKVQFRGDKIVWVLGAGFSAPLGGPLLPDLISVRSQTEMKFGSKELQRHLSNATHARIAYEAGRRGSAGGPGYWRDGEQFIAQLDEAVRSLPEDPRASLPTISGMMWKAIVSAVSGRKTPDDTNWRQLAEVPRYLLESTLEGARCLVHTACTSFLPKGLDGEPTGEKWGPFLNWGNQLRRGDTVITFNYDTVVELVASEVAPVVTREDVRRVTADRLSVPLLKLHGSVDWRQDGDDLVRDPQTAATDAFMATPGPSKLAAVEGEMDAAWHLAMSRVAEADLVIFVGYRFPESDSASLIRFSEAMSMNDSLRVTAVLGPHPTPDKERLAWIVRASSGINVVLPPAWSQDFLGVVSREFLFDQT